MKIAARGVKRVVRVDASSERNAAAASISTDPRHWRNAIRRSNVDEVVRVVAAVVKRSFVPALKGARYPRNVKRSDNSSLRVKRAYDRSA